ncbi:MAG: sensor histidine kinase [Coprobacillaceae bacterium]
MTITDYIKDKTYIILINIISMLVSFSLLYFTGANVSILYLLCGMWILILMIVIGIGYYKYRKYFIELESIMNQLDKKYLFVECMSKQKDVISKEYYKLFKKMSKSMIEHVSEAEEQQKEYKEYIKAWIHEIKLPITAISIIAENNKNDNTRKILSQLENIDNSVERSLYYARSGVVENDYAIKEIKLQDVINTVISKNKQLYMQNRIQFDVKDITDIVYTDDKWLVFIINQILLNSVKYKSDTPLVTIYTSVVTNGVALHIRDNGIGIQESDLPRIFEKGFTGINGRMHNKATGIGLYLCKKLSNKLGIVLSVTSEVSEYTEIVLTFPKGTFVKV